MEVLKHNAKDITSIVANDLCHSCGACINVCNPKVISFYNTEAGHVFPKIDYDGCTACGLCAKVCPGNNLGKNLIAQLEKVNDPFIGEVINSFVGKSTNKLLLENGQSGGVASSIILYALENNIIDVAIVAIMSYGNEIKGDVFLAYNKNDIIQSQKSKYIPIPILTALMQVKKKKERFAIVGLSCHLHGLNNIIEINKTLKTNFAFSIGLICDRVMVNSGMNYLINKVNIQKEKVTEFAFRDKEPIGYPGIVNIKTNNKSITLPAKERMQIKDFFTPARCRICFDKMNVFADITIGDPHGIDKFDKEKGESLIIVRTKTGNNIVQDTLKNDKIDIRQASLNKSIAGQAIQVKKIKWRSYIETWIKIGKPVPNYYEILKGKTAFNGKLESKSLRHSLSLKMVKNEKKLFKTVERQISFSNKLNLLKNVIRRIVK